MLEPSRAFYVAMFGAMKMGAIAVPLFTLFGPDGIRLRVNDCKPRLLVTNAEKAGVTGPLGDTETVVFDSDFADSLTTLPSTYEVKTDETTWGLRYSQYKIPRGTYNVIEHPLLNAYGSGSSWSKMNIDVDLATFGTAYMRGRKTVFKDFGQGANAADDGIDAIGGTVTTEMTTLVKNPAANGVQYNYTAAAAG